VVPDLVGRTVSAARDAWRDAGFIGSFSPGTGHGNRVVETQDRPAGACLAAATDISVTYGRPG
jgi:hypothetical protein